MVNLTEENLRIYSAGLLEKQLQLIKIVKKNLVILAKRRTLYQEEIDIQGKMSHMMKRLRQIRKDTDKLEDAFSKAKLKTKEKLSEIDQLLKDHENMAKILGVSTSLWHDVRKIEKEFIKDDQRVFGQFWTIGKKRKVGYPYDRYSLFTLENSHLKTPTSLINQFDPSAKGEKRKDHRINFQKSLEYIKSQKKEL